MRKGTCSECSRPVWARGLCSSHYSAWHRRENGRRESKRLIFCVRCGDVAIVTKRTARFCSHACYIAARFPPPPAPSKALVHVGRLPRPTGELVHARSGWLWIAGLCRRCGEPFVTLDPQTRWCTKRCARADARDRRRVRVRKAEGDELVYRRGIFERDGWRCQLCGKRVDRAKVVPHPRAPTLDHIVPVSEGGSHVPANVQCAHFLCNSMKCNGVSGSGEQLRLIG